MAQDQPTSYDQTMPDSDADLKSELSSYLTDAFPTTAGYDSVRVALIYWQDDDLSVIDEVEDLELFWREKFGYKSNFIAIPSLRSQASLTTELSSFVYQYGASKRTLLILYYAGHGDENRDDKEAIWAAKREGGPTLRWHEVQPVLFNAMGDVLMILDCCYALQAARGRQNRTIELLAASGVRARTPPPGNYSFTNIMMRVMNRMLVDSQEVKVYDLWRRLVQRTSEDEEVYADPHHFYLAEGDGSIVLSHADKHEQTNEVHQEIPPALISLTISLSHRPDRMMIKRLGIWLKTAVPKFVSSVEVDEILLKVDCIQSFMHRTQNRSLQQMVCKDLQDRHLPQEVQVSTHLQALDRDGLENEARALVQRLLEWSNQVCRMISSNVMLHPSYTSTLQNLLTDRQARVMRLSEAARLRLMELGSDLATNVGEVRPLPADSVKIVSQAEGVTYEASGLRYGLYGRFPVLIEYHKVTSDHDRMAADKSRAKRDIEHLSNLLSHAKDPFFQLAPFLGYLDEPHKDRYALVFRVPAHGCDDNFDAQEPACVSNEKDSRCYTTLHQQLSKVKWLSLSHRLDMAVALVRAVVALHAVSWLHHNLDSHKIVFFSQYSTTVKHIKGSQNIATSSTSFEGQKNHQPSSSFDLTRLYVFGFDHSRHEDTSSLAIRQFHAERLIYTHPARWGRPSQRYGMEHDIYSLGVVLLEIGCWRIASKMDHNGRAFQDVRHEDQVKNALLSVAQQQLPHMAGDAYSRATIACLDGSLVKQAENQVTKDDNQHDSFSEDSNIKSSKMRSLRSLEIHKALIKRVLDAISAVRMGLESREIDER